MIGDRLSRPVLLGLFFAGILALAGGAAANPERRVDSPSRPSASGAALQSRPFIETVEQLDQIASFAAGQPGAELARSHLCIPTDVGVHPLPPPFRTGARRR